MEFKFTPENLERINAEIKKYPVKQPAVMAALYIGQEQNGFISQEVIKEVANILDMHAHDVMGVVSFYTMYHQKQMGKYHIQVCTNVSCMLRGGYDIWNQVKDKLGIDNWEVSADQKFSLRGGRMYGKLRNCPDDCY
jgi:NADH-quinone oxidoreductase subunit E